MVGMCKEKTIQVRIAINPKVSLRIIHALSYGNHRTIPKGTKLSKRPNAVTTGRRRWIFHQNDSAKTNDKRENRNVRVSTCMVQK